jgi:deazaflavin-dependent oxidoreductase (nitroreductase family)
MAIGSNYGRTPHPSWSANLLAHPDCEVEFRGTQARYRARLLEGEERDRAWEASLDWFAGSAPSQDLLAQATAELSRRRRRRRTQ